MRPIDQSNLSMSYRQAVREVCSLSLGHANGGCETPRERRGRLETSTASQPLHEVQSKSPRRHGNEFVKGEADRVA